MLKKIKSKLSFILKSELVATSKLSLIATSFGILTNLSLNKLIASTTGPSGIAIFSQIQNLLNFSSALSTGGINNGVIKLISEKTVFKINEIISTSFFIILFFSVISSLILITFNDDISIILFGNSNFTNHILLLSLNLPFLAYNNLFVAILNGERKILNLVKIRIATHLFQLTITLSLLYFFGFNIGIFGFLSVHFFVFVLAIFFIVDKKYLSRLKIRLFEKNIFRKLMGFSLIAIVSFSLTPLVETLIRGYITKSLDINNAGLWDGLNKISQSVLGFFSLTLSIYLLPKFSSIKNFDKLKIELIKGLKYISFPLLIILFFIFYFKSIVIKLLFSETFLVLNDFVSIQLVGVFFKTIGWVFGYLLISRNLIKPFLVFEIFFQIFYVVTTFYLLNYFNFLGLTYSYALMNILYSLTLGIYIFRYYLKS